jgi:pimeloyl-ACP methyl ester carboxylesterase
MSELDVTLRDGRTLHVYDDGDPDGYPVVVHHGTPGSGLLYGPDIADAKAQGLRLIGYDRAGYGGSTPKPGRLVADVAADIADVLHHLGLDRFASVGGSGGGPHSLALGALLPHRCVAVCSIASPAPWQAEGLDWLQGQGDQNRAEWAAALEGPDVLEPHLERDAADLLAASAEQIRAVLSTVISDVDREALTGELAEHFHASTARALRPGVAGWRDDDLAFSRHWGFELEEIRVPILLWQGVQDKMVPVAHGEWLAERLPDVEAHISEEDGHLSIAVSRRGEIYDWIAERL